MSEIMAVPNAKARLGVVARRHPHNTTLQAEARRDYAAARLQDFITKTVDAAPPLTDEQRDRLTLLLRPNPRGVAA